VTKATYIYVWTPCLVIHCFTKTLQTLQFPASQFTSSHLRIHHLPCVLVNTQLISECQVISQPVQLESSHSLTSGLMLLWVGVISFPTGLFFVSMAVVLVDEVFQFLRFDSLLIWIVYLAWVHAVEYSSKVLLI
jgi:hypothetical protein